MNAAPPEIGRHHRARDRRSEECDPMNPRPRLVSSISFWVLLVLSLASLGYGLWIVLDKINVMTSTLQDQSATGVEVYAGQSWIVFGAAFIGAGAIGVIVTLALVTVSSLLPRPAVAVVETIDWTTEDADVETTASTPPPAAATSTAPEAGHAGDPTVAGEPLVEDEPVVVTETTAAPSAEEPPAAR
jgi:hypothetical protein